MNGLPSTERFFSALCPGLLVFMYSEEDPAIASQVYWPVSFVARGLIVRLEMAIGLIVRLEMAIGLIVRLEMYGVDIAEGEVVVILPVRISGLHFTVTLISVLTVGGRVAVQVRVWDVPW